MFRFTVPHILTHLSCCAVVISGLSLLEPPSSGHTDDNVTSQLNQSDVRLDTNPFSDLIRWDNTKPKPRRDSDGYMYNIGNETDSHPDGNRSKSGRKKRCYDPDGSLVWDWKVRLVLVPLFTTIGLIGNSLSFVVWMSGPYRGKSYTYYLRSLAVFDNITLISTCLVYFDELFYCYHGYKFFSHHTEATCQVSKLLRNVMYLMSSWMVVCFTVDRYLAVCRPFVTWRISTARGAILSILALVAVAVTTQVYSIVYLGLKVRNQPSYSGNESEVYRTCAHKSDPREYFRNGTMNYDTSGRETHAALEFFFFSFTLRFFIPFVMIAVCNGYIIAELRRKRYDPVGRENMSTRTANTAIYTLHLVCVVFILTLLPHACLTMVLFVIYTPTIRTMPHHRLKRLHHFIERVSLPFEMILMMNYTFNFVLYGLSGTQFRRTVVDVLSCRRARDASRETEHIPLNRICKRST